ncbi:type IV pilus assembly protein PilM [Patescibacteria group bacterium]|nr:type IV pilus assembly protein PilM [Patescibacteria group bacterium]MBU1705186.1 type IV pilus assembly protein PilM [Patescibacteria group bacterium]
MGLFGGAKKDSYLGIDIGAGGIKLVELANEKGRATVLTYGYSVRQPGEAVTSPFDDVKGTGETLAKLCDQAGTKSKRAMAALPISSVFTAIISIPRRKEEKEMKPLIDAQVSKLTPLPLSDMITYSTFIDNLKEDKTQKAQGLTPGQTAAAARKKDYVRVLVTGAAKSLVQKYIEIFKIAKLELQAIDTEAFALIRALVGKDKSSIMLLDIGSMRTNITIVEKGIPFLTRSINVGGSAVTKRIMEQTGLPEDQAEQMKMDLASAEATGQTAAGGMPAILEAAMQPILNEINYSFQLYEKMELTEMKRVEKVIVTGGSSHLPRVPEYFSEKLNLNVYRGDPWARVAVPHDLRPVLDEIGPRMSIAIGLAMREMD